MLLLTFEKRNLDFIGKKGTEKMSRKYLIFLISLSLPLIACKDTVEDHIKSKKISAEVESDALAAFKAKVRSSVGHSKFLKAKSETWKSLHIGQVIGDNDHIMTEKESEVVLNTVDGTVLMISENTTVEFNTELKSSIKGEVNIFIRNGNIQFDVQKQKDNQFNFKTGTATASIRGTAGFVGSLDGQMVASLKEGLVEVTDAKGRSSNITQNQTLLVTKSGEAKTIQLESSGTPALFSALETMVKEVGLDNVETLEKSLQIFDASYVEEKKKFEENLTFAPVSIPAKISNPSITLKAKLTPGVFVTVMGVTDTVPASGEYERTFTWDKSASGTKRFMAVCSDGNVEVSCNTWSTEYENPENPAETPLGEPVDETVVDSLAKADSLVADSSAPAADSLQAPAEEVAAVEPPVEEVAKVEPVKKAAKPAKKPVAVKIPEPKPSEWVLKLMGASQDPLDTLEEVSMKKRQALGEARFNILLYKPNCSAEGSCLGEVQSVTVFRNNEVFKVFQGEDITTVIPVDVTVENGKMANYRVVVKMNDKKDPGVAAMKVFQSKIVSSR